MFYASTNVSYVSNQFCDCYFKGNKVEALTMKTRYTNRSMPGQKKILLWCYGFWFIACFLSITLAVQAKEQSSESTIAIVQEHAEFEGQAFVCKAVSLKPLLRLIPIG